ncbi:hypothetical protein ACHAW6_009310 [Cyclotella cf. meneghiniana]
MEKEILSIVAMLEEIQGMLLGSDLQVFTDHKNFTSDYQKNQCVLHLRNEIKDSPTLHNIEGFCNILVINLS